MLYLSDLPEGLNRCLGLSYHVQITVTSAHYDQHNTLYIDYHWTVDSLLLSCMYMYIGVHTFHMYILCLLYIGVYILYVLVG